MDPDKSLCTYCSECRFKNSVNIKKRIKMDGMVSQIIRMELLKNPSLEMDILCSMKRRAALDSIVLDINKLQWGKRAQWCLFVMDLDFLKAWNSCLGHVKADGLIKIIGGIIFVPAGVTKGKDWLEKGDKVALEHAKKVHLPKKNGIAIYYEEIGLVDDKKVLQCLEKGVNTGYR